ncbi:MAG TPA: Asp-tRNA(Asn)/Glu-tRNA(Gln) amidotransferase GatCAB subunit A, partial [Treponema sp.]|nr:Asp-tRNA(Asn)/Glu-tRNA(Gln) amidotransferase GatCAB subunit A [Treponema sp.]
MQTISGTIAALKAGTVTSRALVQESIDTFEADRTSALPLNAFLEIYDDALALADAADKEI